MGKGEIVESTLPTCDVCCATPMSMHSWISGELVRLCGACGEILTTEGHGIAWKEEVSREGAEAQRDEG